MRRCLSRLSIFTAVLAGVAASTPVGAGVADTEDQTSLLGNYLAGRVARSQNDTGAAAQFYRQALMQDPGNNLLVEQAFLMETSEGDFVRAEALARELIEAQPSHRTAHALIGLADFKAQRYAAADEHFKAVSGNPIGELTSALARAWVAQAQGRTNEALELLEAPKLPDWAQFYLRYHRALLADVAGRRAEAQAAYEKIPANDQKTLRITLAFARHAANAGDSKLAQRILKAHLDKAKADGHPEAKALMEQIEGGAELPLLVSTPTEGLAEAFYGLGEALTGEGGVSVGAVYLQFALFLRPDFPFALATLANAYETTKRYEAAIAAYDRIPNNTALQVSIEIRKALNLNQLDRVEEAKELLEGTARRNPTDVRPLDALGGIMRGHKRYAEAVDYYSRAIQLIDKPEQKHWSFFYSRGTCYERIKKWALAEADLQRALQLSPDQPLALNYLGYSWIDQGRNLKQGMALIEKAVRQKSDDGYIVDSLGWAHYRLGNYKEAVKNLERAVELRPEDPVLNDHLGDALWRVGREREARFQWEQALTLNPEPEDADKIKRKLQRGLSPQQARPVKRIKEVVKKEHLKKSSETSFSLPLFK